MDICKKTLADLFKSSLYNPNVLNRCVGKVQAPVMWFTYLLIQHIKQLRQGTFLPLIQLQLELKWLSATQFSVKITGDQVDVLEISSLSGEPFKNFLKTFYIYTSGKKPKYLF